jgi:hypothetical protein
MLTQRWRVLVDQDSQLHGNVTVTGTGKHIIYQIPY